MLPNGLSLEMGHWCTYRSHSIFEGLSIYVLKQEKSGYKEWIPILNAAGARLVSSFAREEPCDYVVSFLTPSDGDVKFLASKTDAPIVTYEWVVQCLINQRLLPVLSHSKYHW